MAFTPVTKKSGIDLSLEMELEEGVKSFNLKVKQLSQKELDELNSKKEKSSFDLKNEKEALEELIATNPSDKSELEKRLREIKETLAREKLARVKGKSKISEEIEKNRPYWREIFIATILESEDKKAFINLIDKFEVEDLPNLYSYILEEMEKAKKK